MADIDYRELRRQVQVDLQRQKRLTRWIFFVVNLMLYLLFTVMAWGMYFSSGAVQTLSGSTRQNPVLGAMILLTVVGGLGVMFQFISAMLDTRAGEASMRARATAKLMADEVMRLGEEDETEQEKAKRSMRLSDEGELEELTEDEIAALEERRKRARS